MLRATIEAGMKMRVIRPAELKRVNVDTTVETKAIRFPTDARLYQRMRERLASRGETLADVVVIQGDRKETLRLFGEAYSVGRVRAALFNAALNWSPLELE